MSGLPSGWVDVEIGEIAEVVAGGTPKANDASNFEAPGAGIAWLTPADLSGYKAKEISHGSRDLSQKGYESCSAKLMPKGSLLFSSRAPIGYVALAANEISTNQGFKSFVFPKEIDPSYAFYYLKSIRQLADSLGTGTTFKELSGTTAKTLPFRMAPENEQTRIAQKLDELLPQVDTLKARIDAIPALLKRFRQSVLAAAVSGRLTEEWRKSNDHAVDIANAAQIHQSEWLAAREREYQRKQKGYCENTILRKFKPAPFQEDGTLPPSWLTTSLSNLAEVTDPNPSHRMPKYTDTGTPFISTENFGNNGQIDFSIGKKVTEEELEAQRARYEIQEGTFAFTRIGTIGRSVFLPTPHNYCISHAVAVVQPYTKLTAPKFLKLVASAPSTLSQATDGVQSVGVPDLGVGKMKSFKIPMPPIDEQIEIVRRVEQLFAFADQLGAKVASAKSRIDHLTQSILARAFRGELVPQDPNDEPASVLLERIQAQRAAAPKAKRGRKASA
ncbi:restriction endonuclease subunit S [Pseudomonas sp. KB-10]|uniref:restriction endonuclease subunit S n=1 Tax=Pseudomonas sp. KB-10 TaxID=2292264 RepID=UPI001BB045E7|nr:restriction endonuclease subunit S [Pseudomonas sp. KB-10]